LSRLFYEADRGPRLAAQPENRPRRNLIAPVCCPYCSRVPLLVLFDVDKTLFMTSDPLMGQATADAIATVWGLTPPGNAIRGVDHSGQTAMRITREMLRTAGLDDDEINPQIARWCTEASRRYLELLADADTSHWAAAEGAADAISQIEHRALLTGNPEPVARARMERIGLAELFPPGQGAFGCEAESRDELIAIARRKAGDWPAERTVAVGDTENDIAGARAAGIHVIGFGQGLDDADAVIERMSELPPTLERLSAEL
jgi:phosphoglycolate phosphatase-like HAD superfamily hydrolase